MNPVGVAQSRIKRDWALRAAQSPIYCRLGVFQFNPVKFNCFILLFRFF